MQSIKDDASRRQQANADSEWLWPAWHPFIERLPRLFASSNDDY